MEPRPLSHLEELEALQDEVLQELDLLNERIVALLEMQGESSGGVPLAESA